MAFQNDVIVFLKTSSIAAQGCSKVELHENWMVHRHTFSAWLFDDFGACIELNKSIERI